MISREDVAQAIERAHWPQSVGSHERALWIADAILALIRPEVALMPTQRDERAEKLGERLDAAERQLAQELANLSATAERCRVLEERARNTEALAANLRRVDNERAIELMRVKRELDAAWLRHTWPCGHISEGTGDEPDRCRICVAEERARNAEALAANLKRLENERAIELMRVRRELAAAEERAQKAEAAEDREASLADLLNSWARESGVAPCDRPEDSKGVADRLWAKLSLDGRPRPRGVEGEVMAFPCTEEVGGCGHPACRRERAEMAVRRAQCRHCKWGRPCDEHTRPTQRRK